MGSFDPCSMWEVISNRVSALCEINKFKDNGIECKLTITSISVLSDRSSELNDQHMTR